MPAYTTTNITSSNYTANSNASEKLVIRDGGNTYELNYLPGTYDNTNSKYELAGIGKNTMTKNGTTLTKFTVVYKKTDLSDANNPRVTWDAYMANTDNSSGTQTVYAQNVAYDETKVSVLESLVGLNLNGDSTTGPAFTSNSIAKNTTGSTVVPDSGDHVLARASDGAIYILAKETGNNHPSTSVQIGADWYDPIHVRDSNTSIRTPSFFDESYGGTIRKAVAVVKGKEANLPTINGGSTGGYNAVDANADSYFVAIKVTYSGQDKPQWEIRQVTLDGEVTNFSRYTQKITPYENFFNQDLNGDGDKNIAPSPTAISGDNAENGVVAGRNFDGDIFVKTASNGNFKAIKEQWGNTYPLENYSASEYQINQSAVVAATAGDKSGTYLLAVKNTTKYVKEPTKADTVTWDVYTLKTKTAFLASSNSSSGSSSSGSYYPTGSTSTQLSSLVGDDDLIVSYSAVDRSVSIGDYEIDFNQDLNGDGTKGLNKADIKAMSTDTQGVRLERDSKGGGLFLAVGNGDSRELTAIGNASGLEYDNNWGMGSNKREAVAVEAIRNSSNVITSYKIALKRTEKYSSGSYAASPAGSSSSTTASDGTQVKVSWDILNLDADGKLTYGYYDNTTKMWKDDSVYSATSIAPYESIFNEDLNGDGTAGIDVASLTLAVGDKTGVKLARDKDKALYIVDGNKAKAVGNASWLEYNNSWEGGANKNEAVAVEAIRDNSNNITGYRLATKMSNTYQNVSTVSWDILKLDADAKITYGYHDSTSNSWKDESVRGQKSIAPYEELFGDDLNGDGRVGVDVATLTKVSTDTAGILLARDKDNSLYLLDGNNAKAVSASWLEYSNAWGNGSNKKEAIAVEAVRNNAGTITGYKLALKQTDVYDGKTTVNWEVVNLTTDAKLESTSGASMAGGSSQTKSISAFEDVFNQDLNGDGRIGIDTANLVKVSTDTTGLYLARDAEKALYIVNGNSAKAVGNSSWLEYDNNWGSGSNKREAIAVEAVRDGNGNITAYKLAMKQTNNWNGTDNVTWDVLHLDTDAKITYGSWSNTENKWVDNSVYGVKSMVAYETLFDQDLNSDGKIGIDVATLKIATTDTRGVRLARDKDNALFIVDGAGAAAVAKAVGNASWLEYNNSWGGGSNKMEAIAVEATRDGNNTITGYKLALKQTNDWNGNKDENWQVLNLDAQGNVNWGGATGSTLWTKKIRQVENLVQEDLNNDGTTGISSTNLTAFTEERLTGADDNVKLAKDSSDNAFYIMDNNTAITLMDSFGSTPELTYTRQWGSGSSTSEVMGVAKQTVGNDYQFRIAVKVTNTYGSTTDVSWQIHTVSKDGVLDWSKVATARSPGRFESIFGQDLDGVASATPTAIATDTGTVKLLKDEAGVLYIQDTGDTDNNGITYLVDAQGGSPSFDFDTGSLKSESYAIHKLADNTYRLAVKKTTSNRNEKWEVYNVGARNATTDEAAINRSKTVFLKDVRDVEALINQDINADGTVGRPAVTTDVANDDGVVKAALTAQNQLYINNNGTKIAVVDSFGVGVILNKSETWDSGASSFVADVVTAEKVDTTVNNVTTRTYKIAVRETTTLKDQEPSINWKIYTTDASGLLNPNPVETKSIARWETLFNQDLTPNVGASLGVDQASLTPLSGDSDVALDADGAVYVRNSGSLIQVTDGADGAISFESSETLPDGFSTSKVVGAQVQDSGNILLAVEYASQVGDVTDKSWVVHTLAVQGTGASAYASIDWTKAVVTDDMTDYAALFGQTFTQDVATLGA